MFDSHAHLNDKRFENDLEAVVSRAFEGGIQGIINVGWDIPSSWKAVELAETFPNCYAVVGVHPHDAKTYDDRGADEIRKMVKKTSKVVAIGETGLDFYYDNSPRDIQRSVFQEQLRLAAEVDLPVVVHSRDAAADTLAILEEAPSGVVCVLHCYSGSLEMAQRYIDMGHYISFAGPLTFKNASRLRQVAKGIPLDRVLIETDCPYLTPEPHRGKRNEPLFVRYVAERLAELYGLSPEELGRVTAENTRRFFRLSANS